MACGTIMAEDEDFDPFEGGTGIFKLVTPPPPIGLLPGTIDPPPPPPPPPPPAPAPAPPFDGTRFAEEGPEEPYGAGAKDMGAELLIEKPPGANEPEPEPCPPGP